MHRSNPKDDTAPITEKFNLDSVIQGLASDLEKLRAGKISVSDALARAALAKQVFNGLRIVINAQLYLEKTLKPVKASEIPAPERASRK